MFATLIRLLVGGGLAALVHAQTGVTVLGVLVCAFLLTVVWSPLARKAVG